MNDPHVLLDLVSTVKRSIAPGSLEPSNNTRIIVHVAAMDHHHVGTRTSGQSTLLPKIVAAAIDPTATARIRVLALGPWTQIDARPILRASKPANVATTLMNQMAQGRVRASRIASVAAIQMDQTAQEHVRLSRTVSVAMTLIERIGPEHAHLSKIASVATTLTGRIGPEHAHLFRIANAVAQMDQTE